MNIFWNWISFAGIRTLLLKKFVWLGRTSIKPNYWHKSYVFSLNVQRGKLSCNINAISLRHLLAKPRKLLVHKFIQTPRKWKAINRHIKPLFYFRCTTKEPKLYYQSIWNIKIKMRHLKLRLKSIGSLCNRKCYKQLRYTNL